jgi:phosphate transport system permease protein
MAISAPLSIFIIFITLFFYSVPSILFNGFHYFTSIIWNPRLNGNLITFHFLGFSFGALQGASYGLLVFLVGTLISSALAIIIGVPLAIGAAILISQYLPKRIAPAVSFFIELLAGIPSVVFGLWGFIILAPYVLSVENHYLSKIPGLEGTVYGSGLLVSGIVLALMIVPIVASLSRDAMIQTPLELKEGARALGLTDWEVTRKIVLPYAKTGMFGGIVLGLGRALGETMAVAMVSGGAINILPRSLYYNIQSMAGYMAVSLDSAFTDGSGMYVSALMELALVLSVITIVVNVVARIISRQGFFKESSSVVRV